MHARTIILAVTVLAGFGTGQTWSSPPPLCFAFNDTASTALMSYLSPDGTAGALTVHFNAPVSAAIERVDFPIPYVYVGPCLGPGAGYALYATSSPGGALVGPPLATFGFASVLESSSGWGLVVRLTTPAISLTAGSSYALVMQGFCVGCSFVGYDGAGTTPLTYQLVTGPCQPSVPTSGQLPFALRFRGTACGPGPLASTTVLGGGCTSSASTGSGNPPVLGAPWFVSVWGPSSTAHLFWSVGVNAAGTSIPGSSCLNYLDPVSLQALVQLGVEPIVSATMPGSNLATFVFTVPAQPGLAGAVLGLQTILVGPWGTVPIGGGAFADITNALALTLGY